MVSGLSAVLAATYATYTSARAAWVAGVVAVLLLCAMLIREQRLAEPAVLLNRGKAVKAGLGILAVAVAMNLSPDGFQLRTKRIAQEAASVVAAKGDPLQHGGGRPAIWANTLAMIRDTPALGVGLANFWVFYPLYHKAVGEDRGVTESKVRLHAHNDYLQHGAELGVPGAALFLALLVLALWSNHRVLSTSPSPHDRLLSIAVLGGILGFMIEAVFTFPMERAIPPLYLFVFLALSNALADRRREIPERVLAVPRAAGALACLVVIGISTGLLRFHAAALQSDRLLLKADRAGHQGRWDDTLAFAFEAYDMSPHRKDALYYIGRAQIERGRFLEAIQSLHELSKHYPYDINSLSNLGLAYLKSGDRKSALKTFHQVLDIRPDYTQLRLFMVDLYTEKGQNNQALELCNNEHGKDKDIGYLKHKKGLLLAQQQLWKDAAEAFEDALEHHPSLDEAHKHLGILYYRHLGRTDRALHHMRRFVKARPQTETASHFTSILEQHGG